jgi:hypothetical protein
MYTKDDKDDLVSEIRNNWKESKDLLSEWRKEAKECYGFVSGDQWSSEDKAVLEEEGRPCVTFNRIGAIVDVICGIEVNNRQDVHYFPRSMGDVPLNEINTAAGKWARDECYAEDEESESFRDAVICGVGCTETKMDYDENPDGKIVIERKDPLHMTWKASARKSCLDDSPYVFNAEWMDKKEAKARWPEAEVLSSQDLWDDQTQPHNADKAYLYENDSTDQEKRKDQVLVLHYQCWKLEPYIRTLDPFDQQIKSFSEEEFEDIKKKAEMIGFIFVDKEKQGEFEIPYVKQKRKVYYRAFLIGDDLLEYDKSPSQEGFTFRFITGKRDRNKNCWYGVVRPLIDPQRFGNKFFSQVLHIINSNAKGGAFVEENALKDPRKAEEQWSSNRGPLIQLTEGGISKIRERQPASYPQGLDRLMTFSFESMPWVSGMNPEMLGMADKAQAGVLEEQRKRSAVTILAPLFNSLRRYRKSQGRLLLYYIREYISDGRLVRIIGENGDPRFIPLVKDASTDEYDTIVDQSPSSPDFKREVWNSVQPLLPFMMKNGYQIPDALIDLSPMPSWVASEVKKSLQGQLPPVAKQQISQMQEQMQKMAQEMQKLKEENLMLKVDKSVDLQKSQINYAGREMATNQKEVASQRQASIEAARLDLDAQEAAANRFSQMMEQNFRRFEMAMDEKLKVLDVVRETAKTVQSTQEGINV